MSLAVFVKRPQALQISASKGDYSSFAPARQAAARGEIAGALTAPIAAAIGNQFLTGRRGYAWLPKNPLQARKSSVFPDWCSAAARGFQVFVSDNGCGLQSLNRYAVFDGFVRSSRDVRSCGSGAPSLEKIF
ncbi:hypothetical protein [Vandammella animalimorsus]|uniref:hypothetical protein n=1 Tax=Vandammella animalimorsus TaxID=2029117 RepID=UPI001177654E|nr:hypothetical protein [Vandammella animalimorsus]